MLVELIDTLWNVNKTDGFYLNIPDTELIDTLWNVNLTSKQAEYLQGCRINRYIMECKYHYMSLAVLCIEN